jgi:hypothetical protein
LFCEQNWSLKNKNKRSRGSMRRALRDGELNLSAVSRPGRCVYPTHWLFIMNLNGDRFSPSGSIPLKSLQILHKRQHSFKIIANFTQAAAFL